MTAMQRLKPHATISWNPESRQIRILTLLPGQWSDPIQCRLTVSSLDDRPHYETISYAWGDPNNKRVITIENGPLEVPMSLELALRHLRKEDESLALWADAICIDQSHREEKAHQVAMMGEIFSKCSSVNIWLGTPKDSESSSDPFALVNHFAENKHFYELPGFSVSEETQELSFQDNVEYQEMWNAFERAMTHPWWSRLWCIQESILPPAGTVIRGHWRISWQRMRAASLNHQVQHWSCCSVANSLLPKKYVFNPDHLLDMSDPDHEDKAFVESVSSLETVLRLFRHKQCEDPRDRIYGLLGLLALGRAPLGSLRPDYSLSARSVFMNAMRVCVLQSPKDLIYLTGSGFNSEQYDLPSWTRNFAMSLPNIGATVERARSKRYHAYDASSGKESDVRHRDDDTLALTGHVVDEVEEVGVAIEADVWRDPTWIGKVFVNAKQIAGTDALNDISFQQPLHQAFWRTLMADGVIPIGGEWRRMTTSDHESLQKRLTILVVLLKNDATAGGKSDPEVNYTLNSIQVSNYSRAFYRTKHGRFGLCFPNTRPGDQVWILAGGRVPFILRPSMSDNRGEPEEENRFRLVGECYCHGLMDGEGLSGKEVKMGEIFLV
ncbi:heterokaryon incompatibility protein-domain-containing protein [Lophiotrema nucula]|uniref:Heterokaryon incompatibility protein-domain-containing protein n=1 Tax=Lophiotrema nucula TaxID=690887 RepID=A0A6A5YYB4_9PLEO|nr:heterokaryon incompatibility protein-domain-containing protein [Lophiotrema nucula]